MPTATIDGIETYYEVSGSGPPLLLFSPGGFNAALDNWSAFGIYKRLDLLTHLRGNVVVWDRGGNHKGPVIRPFLARNRRLWLEMLPPWAPEWNPVEPVWSWLKASRDAL